MQEKKLYVGNVNYNATPEEIEELFSRYGTVSFVKMIEGKGFGFVEMGSPEEAEVAMENLNGFEFQGRSLKVDEAKPQQRQPRGDRDRFQGPRGSRPGGGRRDRGGERGGGDRGGDRSGFGGGRGGRRY